MIPVKIEGCHDMYTFAPGTLVFSTKVFFIVSTCPIDPLCSDGVSLEFNSFTKECFVRNSMFSQIHADSPRIEPKE